MRIELGTSRVYASAVHSELVWHVLLKRFLNCLFEGKSTVLFSRLLSHCWRCRTGWETQRLLHSSFGPYLQPQYKCKGKTLLGAALQYNGGTTAENEGKCSISFNIKNINLLILIQLHTNPTIKLLDYEMLRAHSHRGKGKWIFLWSFFLTWFFCFCSYFRLVWINRKLLLPFMEYSCRGGKWQ